MNRYRHLIVGLTCTGADAALIRYAAMVVRLGTLNEVRFVHVLPASGSPGVIHDHDQAQAHLWKEVKAHFLQAPPDVRLSVEVLSGPLMDQLLSFVAEHEVDLLLLGHRASQPGRSALARRLAMKAPCSVWVVPDGYLPRLNCILVPIDFSEHSADTMRVATQLARLSDAECLALHVYFNTARVTYEEYDQVIRGEEQRAFEQFITPINCQGANVTPIFEEGANVAHAISRTAKKHAADLVIMASRGRSRSAAILLGSVTEEALTDTEIPLLVVKHFGARMNLLQVLLDRRFRQRGGLQWD